MRGSPRDGRTSCPSNASILVLGRGPGLLRGRLARRPGGGPDVGMVRGRQVAGQIGLAGRLGGGGGEVGPLVGVGRLVVQLLAAVLVADVPPALAPDGVVLPIVSRE